MTTKTKGELLEALRNLKKAGFFNEGSELLMFNRHFRQLEAIIESECLPVTGGIMPPLVRPCIFLDLETTGTNVDLDFIVELTILKVNIDLSEEKKTTLLNPGIPIPDEARAIHGITDDMVKDAPTFAQVSKGILKFIEGCDVIGFGSNRFDVPMLSSMFLRVGLKWEWKNVHLIDALNIFRIHEKRTLSDAVSFYLNKDHDKAHSAEADVNETKAVFIRQLIRYDLPTQFDKLALYCNEGKPMVDLDGKFGLNENGFVIFNFGKHKGKIAKFEKNYLSWMTTSGDFTRDTKAVAQQQFDIPLKKST